MILFATAALAACGEPSTQPAPHSGADAPAAPRSRPSEFGAEEGSWGKFHSQRFQLTVPLPDGRAWKIDDHRRPELIATHAPTESQLTILITQETELMNRQRCEERARQRRDWVAESLTTVDDQVQTGPEAFDSRVWTAIEAAKPGGAVVGHVYLFGAFLRRCLLVHLSTSVPSAQDEAVLASRLAVGATRIVKAITLDPLRTTDDATVPRVKPDIRR